MNINKLTLFRVFSIALFFFSLIDVVKAATLSNNLIFSNDCNATCQQHIQSMLDTYRTTHQTLAVQMAIGLPNKSIINFNSGTLTDPKIDPAAKPVTNHSLFKFNSITKTFTAAIIFQLENEGKLYSTDTVGKWFPDEYPEWKNITIDEMLHMTSGIQDYGKNKNFLNQLDKDWSRIWTAPELSDFGYYEDGHIHIKPYPWCTDSSCPFSPGRNWNYSNTNYILLTQIIEKASGQSYKENLDNRIINRAAIQFDKDSIIYDPDNPESNPDKLTNMVHVYYQSKDLTSFPISIERGAGGIIANAENLVKWFQALFKGKILSPSEFYKMTSIVCEDDEGIGACASIDKQGHIVTYQPGDPMPNDKQTNNGYSSGLFTAIYPNLTKGDFIWQSNGGDPVGYVSAVIYFKDAKMVIGLMENNPDHALDAENFMFDVKAYLSQQIH